MQPHTFIAVRRGLRRGGGVVAAALAVAAAAAGSASAAVVFQNDVPAAGAPVTWSLNDPQGVGLDGTNLIVADTGNNTLRLLALDGTAQQSALQSSRCPDLHQPRQAVRMGNDYVVSESFGFAVRKINASTCADDGEFDQTPPVGGWAFPLGVAANAGHTQVAVADASRNGVYLYDAAGTLLKTLQVPVAPGPSLDGPEDAAFDAAGHVWVADTQNDRIVEFDPSTGGVIATLRAPAGSGMVYPTGLAIDQATGNLWVADFHANEIFEISASGSLITRLQYASSSSDPLSGPLTTALDQAGYLYVADTYNNRIVRYAGAGSGTSPPPPPTTTGSRPYAVTQIPQHVTGTSMQLRGLLASTGGLDTTYQFRWGRTLGEISGPQNTPIVDVGANAQLPVQATLDLNNLQPDTPYCFVLTAHNSRGWGSEHLKCASTAGPAKVSIDPPASISLDSITFSGSINPDGLPTRYYFQYWPQSDSSDVHYVAATGPTVPPGDSLGYPTDGVPDTGTPITGSAPVTRQATAEHLDPATTYCYELVASNAAGPPSSTTPQCQSVAQLPTIRLTYDGRPWDPSITQSYQAGSAPKITWSCSSGSYGPVKSCTVTAFGLFNGTSSTWPDFPLGKTSTSTGSAAILPELTSNPLVDGPWSTDCSATGCTYALWAVVQTAGSATAPASSSSNFYSLTIPAVQPQSSVYAALGDSYASGQGTGTYAPETNTDQPHNHCYRSDRSYAALLNADSHPNTFKYVACSGAETDDIYNPNNEGNLDPSTGQPEAAQIDALNADTTEVTLTVGGNDVGFQDIAKRCLVGYVGVLGVYPDPRLGLPPCSQDSGFTGTIDSRIGALAGTGSATTPEGHYIHSYAAIVRDILARAPNAHLFLAGYPLLLPSKTASNCQVGEIHAKNIPILGDVDVSMQITPTDARWLVGEEAKINQAMRDATANTGGRATFVDPNSAFAGHHLCDSVPWINPLTGTALGTNYHFDSQTFHPTDDGQRSGYQAPLQSAGAG